MGKRIYIVRHCEAEGQQPEAKLTSKGIEQSLKLAEFFSKLEIDRVISSPYKRTIQSIEPTIKNKQLQIEIDDRLKERILSTEQYTDWLKRLEETYLDMDLKFEGGESSREAMNRIITLVEEVIKKEFKNTIIVTHGNLMSLLLKYFDSKFGFIEWKKLSNPDVFELHFDQQQTTKQRIWNEVN